LFSGTGGCVELTSWWYCFCWTNKAKIDEFYKILINPIQKIIAENKVYREEERRISENKAKEEDLRIRKQYGIKDDEDWFDGRSGIKTYKRSK
jgi:hypothetical protein